jgi:uncharacterized membrane protein (UPF0127 family)
MNKTARKQLLTRSNSIVVVKYFNTRNSGERGLMFRKTKLGERCGALFSGGPFKGVWMKNTYIPLDVIVIDSNNVVVETVTNMKPLSNRVHFFNSKSVSKFIEVDHGFVEKNKIRKGQKLKLYFER